MTITTTKRLRHLSVVLLALPTFVTAQADGTSGLKPPSSGLQEVGYQDVVLQGGFWGPRLETHHRITIPHVLDKLEERHHLTNFDIAARVIEGAKVESATADNEEATRALEGNAGGDEAEGQEGPKDGIVGHIAFDSDVHKALEGACYTLRHADDPALRKRVEDMLDRILAAQEDDGYLVSCFTARNPDQKWANMRLNHETYNAGHFFEFAVAYHELDPNTKALGAAKRFADHIDGIFGPGKRYDVGGHQGIELALVRLYRATGQERYLDLCRFFLEERGHAHGAERKPFTEIIPRGDPDKKPGQSMREWRRGKWSMRNGRMQDHKPLLEQTEAEGHAVRAGYMYAAMADVDRFSAAPAYAEVLRKLWEDVVFRKLYITGGVGTAQYGDEGFGDPYLLPNKTYCESCASIANVFWQHRMNLLQGEAKYADVMELVLYNSALSGMSLSGDSYFYQNPLESPKGAQRSEWIGLACCPTNLARFTPQVGGYVYAHADKRLFVNLYAAGEGSIMMNEGGSVKIRQQTNYPWDGKIRLTVGLARESRFDLCLRIPGWALGKPVPSDLYRFADPVAAPVILKVNGEAVEAEPGRDGYVHLERSWKAGDQVDLDLPMPVRRVLAHEKVEACQGKVALMRGPVVYCLEGVDHQDADVLKLSLPRSADLAAEHRADLLDGVTVIRARGLDGDKAPVELTAIPYYAWANREKEAMTVWIHDAVDPGASIDFSKQDPLQVLDILASSPKDWIPMPDAPENWIRKEHIPRLMEKLGSKVPCAGLHSHRDSRVAGIGGYGPGKKGRSTIGHEAAHMIESFRHGLYPKSHAFSIDWTHPDDDALRKWWRGLQGGGQIDGGDEDPDRDKVQAYFNALRKVRSAEEEKKLLTGFGEWLRKNEFDIHVVEREGKHLLECAHFPPVTPWIEHAFFDIENLKLLPVEGRENREDPGDE